MTTIYAADSILAKGAVSVMANAVMIWSICLSLQQHSVLSPRTWRISSSCSDLQMENSIASLTVRMPFGSGELPAIDQASATTTRTAKQRNRERRHGLYKQVKVLVDGGMSQSDAARQLGISLRTVQRWLRAGVFAERAPRRYPHSVDAYTGYLDQRLLQGCRNISQLWRELRQQGYRGNSAVSGTGFGNIKGIANRIRSRSS